MANIPNVTAIPYFNTVTVTAVAAAFKAANAASAGVFIQTGTAAAPVVRLATSADLLTLTRSDSRVAAGCRLSLPPTHARTSTCWMPTEITAVLPAPPS